MTDEALCGVDGFALFGRPTARRQPCAVRADADVPGGDFFGLGNAAKIRVLGECCVGAVVAYLLQLNGIIGENETINAQILPRVQMPNRDGFMTFSRGK